MLTLKSRLSQYCGITFRLRRYFNTRTAQTMYYACIFSLVTYCITVWGAALSCTSKGRDLQKVQHRIVRNLFHHHTDDESSCLFKAFNILKLKDLHTFYVNVYMFKVIKMNIYPNLQCDLDLRIRDHCYGTRGNGVYAVPFPRVENIRINYKYEFITAWNQLPVELRNVDILSLFKKKLTSYLIEAY